MNLIVTSMMKNEAGRLLRPVLSVWKEFADEVVVLDDGSEDETCEVCEDFDAHVASRDVHLASAWGEEAPARAELFELAWRFARVDDWILILDADMIPARSPRQLMSMDVNAVAFVLYDLWQEDPPMYRSDGFWRGHETPRVWMIRKDSRRFEDFEWGERGIHSGHLPLNFFPERVVFAPRDFGLLHYAYSTPELREAKYASYMRVAHQLSDFEKAHASSILDKNVHLEPLMFETEFLL